MIIDGKVVEKFTEYLGIKKEDEMKYYEWLEKELDKITKEKN